MIAQTDLSLHSPPSPAPAVVSASFFLTDINGVVEEDQVIDFEGIMTLRWKDERHAFDPSETGTNEIVYQGPFQFLEIYTAWWPQLILANESGNLERQAQLLKIAPDGAMTYSEEINATAVVPMALRRFPFDCQIFEMDFAVLGFSSEEVQLRTGSNGVRNSGTDLPQWSFVDLHTTVRPSPGLGTTLGSTLVVGIEMARKPGHMLRIVMLPLILLVMLSWSVFWMDRSSLGDRMDISFIVILTVVAYQIIVSEHMPKIAYFTFMSTFLYSIYFVVSGAVVINLLVSKLDQSGRSQSGDRVDRICRWLFPLIFFGFNAASAGYFGVLSKCT